MSSGSDMSSDSYERAIDDQYGADNLEERILAAFREHGKDVSALTREDIAAFEEFHIRGRDATRELAQLADVQAHSDVIDIGSGVGGPARTLAAEYGCSVTGVDLVEEYCRTAEVFTDMVDLSDQVTFQQGNALDLPVADASFDVAWLQHMTMNVEDKQTLMDEAHRVLRTDGRLALYEICAGPGGDTIFPVPWAEHAGLSFLASADELQDFITASGFEQVAWQDVTPESTEWFRNKLEQLQSHPADAPTPLGLNLLLGETAPVLMKNTLRNLEEDRIEVIQAVYDRA